MDNSRIASGFDIELQLGANWFLTALNLLKDNGKFGPFGSLVNIESVEIILDPDWDLQINVVGSDEPILAKASLNDAGDQLTIETNNSGIPDQQIPFGALSNLAAPPTLVKLQGDANHENVLCFLADLNIHAESQLVQPIPLEAYIPRGSSNAAISFLENGQSIAFGMASDTLDRFANNMWHTNLRADDGSHPLPDAANEVGQWSKVKMSSSNGSIKVVLEGDVRADSPIIDIVPDPHVTITILLTPTIVNGTLSFAISTDTDVDTGLLGDLFAGIIGAILGFIIALFTGGLLAGVLIGAAVGIIVLEIVEVVAEGVVQKIIRAMIDGVPVADVYCNGSGIVQIAKVNTESAINLSILDSIPSSIPIHISNPTDEFLYKENFLVTSIYNDLSVNTNGFGVAGTSGTEIRFSPEIVSAQQFNYNGESLDSIEYRRGDGQIQTLPLQEVLDRVAEAELQQPFKLVPQPVNSVLRIPEGKLACVCLRPTAITREDTIITQLEFSNGSVLAVPDAVALQDAAAIVVQGYQLIHPQDYNAYYRAKADFVLSNNLESLPEIV